MASKLDAITNSDGEITKLAFSIVEDKDDSATVELCKKISEFAKNEIKQIVQIAQALKDEIVSYYGYIRVKKSVMIKSFCLLKKKSLLVNY